MVFKVGCDPEFFLFDTKDKMFVSAHDKLPGNKKEPYLLDKGAVQVDGTAVEFNTDPAANAKEFSRNIEVVLRQIREMVDRRYEFKFVPAIFYDQKYWETIPTPHKELGCDPDYDVFGKVQRPPQPSGTMRTAGGHLHAGWTWVEDPLEKSHFEDCKVFNAGMNPDFQVNWDKDVYRRGMYGAGKPFRPKKYGVECRGYSNAWVPFPKLHERLFDELENNFEHIRGYPNVNRNWYSPAQVMNLVEIKL